ncbi:MAG: PspC domain-containing protein [Acidimicrobiia bacterium]|nr:PspC domain-containing protein [Acidimicrobiia bacterium]
MSTENESLPNESTEHFQVLRGRLTRSTGDRIVAGLAGGIAARLGIPTVFVRAGFVALTLAGGFGVLCYVVGWLTTPDERQYGSMIVADRPATTSQEVGLSLGFLALLVILEAVGLWFGPMVWPAALFIFGAAMVWDRSSAESRDRMSRFARPTGDDSSRSRGQVIVGVALMAVGIVVVLASLDSFQALGPVAIAVLLTAAGFMLLFGPWILGLFEDLTEERRARIRSEERADMAAHLHDSVLQTLALIQRSDDPQRMTTLARAQERDLRAWLFEPATTADGGTVGEAVSAAAAKIEADFNVPVEVVVVGDRIIDDATGPLVASAAEAMANAAQHSGARSVSVYVECSKDAVEAWVTDQGSGFDVDGVPEQRRGISESIVARMARSGGEASVVSRPGEGTEIHLRSESR